MSLLDENEIRRRLARVPGWVQDGQSIRWVRTFANFVEAVAFVNRLVEPSEAANHHPDVSIYGYNKVAVVLTTHGEGGLTAKDFDLAATLSQIE